MDTPNEMFNRLMAYGMSRADALAVVKKAQELGHDKEMLPDYQRILWERDVRMRRQRLLEAVGEAACKYGIGAWEMIPSDMMTNSYVLSKN